MVVILVLNPSLISSPGITEALSGALDTLLRLAVSISPLFPAVLTLTLHHWG